MRPEHTRPLLLASAVTGAAETSLFEHLQAQEVTVALESSRPDLLLAAELLLSTVGRLPVRLALDPEGLERAHVARLQAAISDLGLGQTLRCSALGDAQIRVRLGADPTGVDFAAVPVRHGAHLARCERLSPGPTGNALGAMTCAALASAEIFKAAAQVLESRAKTHLELGWCPVTLSDRPQDAPDLPGLHGLDVALVGLGAVGSAAARILSLLPASGRALLVDPERFAPENLGTYSLGTLADARADTDLDAGRWKVELAADALRRFSCEPLALPIEAAIERIDAGELRWPRTVLSGLDSVGARREVQRLWPDNLLDGATSDTMCGLHDVRHGDGACLMCLFPLRTEGPGAAERLAQATGLPADLLRYGDQPLTEEHLRLANPPMRAALADQLGKPICGLAQAVGMTALDGDGYRPSVAFVSQQAACLMVGRLIATRLGLVDCATFVQYDALFGPRDSTTDYRHADPNCFCQQRAGLVERVRAERGALRS